VLANHFDDEDETLPQNGDFFVLRAALGATAVPMTQEWMALAPVDVAALVPSEEGIGVLMWLEVVAKVGEIEIVVRRFCKLTRINTNLGER
jgi:hypothetical protein